MTAQPARTSATLPRKVEHSVIQIGYIDSHLVIMTGDNANSGRPFHVDGFGSTARKAYNEAWRKFRVEAHSAPRVQRSEPLTLRAWMRADNAKRASRTAPVALLPAFAAAAHTCARCGDTGYVEIGGQEVTGYYCDCAAGQAAVVASGCICEDGIVFSKRWDGTWESYPCPHCAAGRRATRNMDSFYIEMERFTGEVEAARETLATAPDPVVEGSDAWFDLMCEMDAYDSAVHWEDMTRHYPSW